MANPADKRTAEATALKVLNADDPATQHIEQIGEREYTIQELSVQGFLNLSTLVGEQAEVLGEAGFFDQQLYDEMRKTKDYAALVKKVASVWKQAPGVVEQFLAIICSAEREDDGKYILRHMKLFSQLPRVLRTFMQTNPWEDLVEDFFQIGKELRERVGAVRGQPEPATENPGTSSQS